MTYNPSKLATKRLNDLDKNELVWIHMNGQAVSACAEHLVLSTLGATLDELRATAHNQRSNVIVPTLATFAVLDQIGSTYERKRRPEIRDPNVNSIKRCLHFFTSRAYNDDEVKALYAFRNAMMHDASMVNTGREGNGPYYRFAFDKDQPTLIQLPATPWDGKWGSAPQTTINREKLHELAFEVQKSVRQAFETNELVVKIEKEELYDRYLLSLPKPPAEARALFPLTSPA